ncbi:MAG: prepilin-type N-terminal cleavage/methylation domain-containing protein [Desulfatirhabdiaceae bacterium]
MKTHKQASRCHSAGFTMIEVMMAIVVLSVALLAFASFSATTISRNSLAAQVTTATTFAQDKLEELKNTSFGAIADSTATESDNNGMDYTVTTTVSPDPGNPTNPTWKDIEVTVSWNRAGDSHSVTLKTIIVQP